MKKVLIYILLLVPFVVLEAQEKSDYSIDKLTWHNPGLKSQNSAYLRMSESDLSKINSFTDAGIYFNYEEGKFKNIFDPESQITGGLDINSYSKLGKIYIYSRFAYDYSHLSNSKWRGLLNPYSTPFMMVDSIPGNASLEMYHMEMGLAFPLGEKFTIGTDIKYNAGMYAKKRDLHNKNTLMDFEIRPGITYNSEIVNVGMNLGYIRGTEKIEYMQVDASTEKYLFDIYGMWMYSSLGFSSAENLRLREYDKYEGAVQFELNLNDFKFFNNFTVLYSLDTQTETGYNNLIHGDADQLTYNYNGTLQYGLKHRLSASYSASELLGYRYLQRQELDPASNVKKWVTYDKMNCYVSTSADWNADYTFRQAFSQLNISWAATIGARSTKLKRAYKAYPQSFTQNFRYTEAYISFVKYLKMKNSELALTPEFSYGSGDGVALDIALKDNTQNVLGDSNSVLLNEQLNEEFNYLISTKFSAGLNVRYTYKVKPSTGFNIYGDLSGKTFIPVGDEIGLRNFVRMTIGFTF